MFTKSAILFAIPGLMLLFVLSSLWIDAGNEALLLTAYGIASAVTFVGVAGSRQIVAALWPGVAATYYCAAALHCVSRYKARSPGTRRYFAVVLPPLESVLLSPRLRNKIAGTTVARNSILAKQFGLVTAIGTSEADLLGDSLNDIAAADQIRSALGTALVVVQAGDWSRVTANPETDAGADTGVAPKSWWRTLFVRLRDQGLEQAIAGALVVAAPVVARVWDHVPAM
jgi:hypothetical protein